MATKNITVFFTDAGVPKTGLSPTINIWNLTTSTLDVSAAAVTEVSAGSMPGWYNYAFTSYNYDESYLFTIDGGAGMFISVCDRYKYGGNESYEEDISYEVWEEDNTTHTTTNTTGQLLNIITAVLVNRTKIDTAAATLTVYDSDCVTPLIVFDLKDSFGNPSVVEVCERTPTTCP
ncbi:MAG: hypothetical protein E4H14_01180 [Candidatus Thorarchaeota archaeon]|nr:MAG: hypothetical protein E4H14_01180 [Candidatus Thorarchaeota archaeon]